MKKPIYLDYMSTTPLDPQVSEKMINILTSDELFGNPASTTHTYGKIARQLIEQAREQVAALIGAESCEIIFTSGATESNNIAIKGAAQFNKNRGKHIITCATEHKAVLDPCKYLSHHGYEVTVLYPESSGILTREQIKQAIRPDTLLISIMHANNEIGVLQDIQMIGELARESRVLYHVDAAQSVGKVPINLRVLPVDLMSFSAHKLYGPKGVGALYIRRRPRVRLTAQIHGGDHEQGIRSGTIATHQAVAMGEAFSIAQNEMEKEAQRLLLLRKRLWQQLSILPDIFINGDCLQRLPGNLNVRFQGIDSEALLMGLHDLALSTSSACTSAIAESSYVLRSIGLTDEQAFSSVRISLGRFTTEKEVDYAAERIITEVQRLRDIAPL